MRGRCEIGVGEAGLFKEDRADEPTGEREYVRVAVERGVDAPEGLTYAAPIGLCAVGDRVRVPLGGKSSAGIVVARGGDELLEGLSASRVRAILKREASVLSPGLIDLARWMSEYYVCPLGMVLGTMVPAAVKHATGKRTREIVRRVDPQRDGEILADPSRRLTPGARKAWSAIAALPEGTLPKDPRELAALIGARSIGAINRLVSLGLLERVREEIVRVREGDAMPRAEPSQAPNYELTRDQARVVEGIAGGLGAFAVNLLRGVTGSGKTEVYMGVIDRALTLGQSAIVLVPEISLTPQTSDRFTSRFRDVGVAVLHSALTASERHRQWARVLRGEARVVVGARSAVFAPIARLGVVVVDEEHDTSYKQDQLPRYHARDTAIKRAQLDGAIVVLGSATPSLESFANARSGRFRLWTLEQRVGGGTLPEVRVIDMARERATDSRQGAARLETIGPTLDRALRATLRAERQAIILLNRRGWATFVACPSGACGWRLCCDDCDSAMVVHRARDLPAGRLVRCHHCLAEKLVPSICPDCQRRLIMLGAGGQRVEDELCRGFGLVSGESLLRIDADTMESGRDYFDALDRFRSGGVRVLLGTQMLAKGHDFPGVSLVGVVSADTALALPDFRSSERTFQLVSQVAGRAGRGDAAGLVIVQTFHPLEPAIVHAASHDYEGFAHDELRVRARSRLPPSTRIARIVSRDTDRSKALAGADRLVSVLSSIIERRERAGRGPGVVLRGPMECAIARISEHYRFEILLTAPRAGDIQAVLHQARRDAGIKSDARTAIDVDPVALF